MEKVNNDFCHNGIFSFPNMGPNWYEYKEIYQKYYRISTKSYRIVKHDCITKIISCLPRLSSNIKHTIQYHEADLSENKMYCYVNNENYDGIGNITIVLSTKHLFENSIINLIKKIRLITKKRTIVWCNIGLMIMHKLNLIKLSETHYEKDKLWYYEISIEFNTTEDWMLATDKSIEIVLFFVDEHLLQSVHVIVNHILLNEKINLFTKMFENLTFNNYFVDFVPSDVLGICDCPSDSIQMGIKIYSPPMGLFIYSMDRNSMVVVVNNRITEIQQKEILKLGQNIYYIPLTIGRGMEEEVMKIKKCCWNYSETKILLQINNVRNNQSLLFLSPLCYHKTIYSTSLLR